MSILTSEALGLSFGAFDLFKGISVRIAGDGKIGLIGPNGIGKTSLLLILAGMNAPTTGEVHVARGRRIGYLRQEAVEAFAARDNTVCEEMRTVFWALEKEQSCLHTMEEAMASGDHSGDLLERYGAALEAFEHAGGYDYELRIQRTLQGLGLGEHHDTPLNHLSGGQKTRALLARLLLEKPDLLILDEPTNHLDSEALEWLERTLRDWEGALLVVSHDRYFLDSVVNTIWEMSRSGIEVYSGNYSAYLKQRQERWEREQQVYEEEKARLQKEVDYVQRNIVRASTNAQAVGRLRRLSRDLAVVEAFGVNGLRNGKNWSELGLTNPGPMGVVDAIRAVNALPAPNRRPPRLSLRLHATHISGNLVLRARNLDVGYPGNRLFRIQELELRRGECAALLGPNGSGKTTFIKTLLGELSALDGQLLPGASLKIGYFAQAHDGLDTQNTVLQELQHHALETIGRDLLDGPARSHLAQFGFRGEDVFKPVDVLSGGERARLALAILALKGANFLLLDEPTNHLDIPAQEALQEVLESYPGTILLVSHDRYLVNRLATQIWELHGGRLSVFKGSYHEYLARRTAGPALPAAPPPASPRKSKPQGKPNGKNPALSGAQSAGMRFKPGKNRRKKV